MQFQVEQTLQTALFKTDKNHWKTAATAGGDCGVFGCDKGGSDSSNANSCDRHCRRAGTRRGTGAK